MIIWKIGLNVWRELAPIGIIVLLGNIIWIHIVIVAHCSCIQYHLSSIVSHPIGIMYLVML